MTATWNVSSEIGENVLFVMFDVISISFEEGLGLDTVHDIKMEVFMIVSFEGVEEGRADAKVHSSSTAAAGACVGCADGGGEVKLPRRFAVADGGAA